MKERRGGGGGGGGEGGSRVLDIFDGHWASICRVGSEVSLEGNLCSSWSNFVRDVASKNVLFSDERQHFSPNRTLMFAGS